LTSGTTRITSWRCSSHARKASSWLTSRRNTRLQVEHPVRQGIEDVDATAY
jgi:hypothetical protein